MVETEWKKKWDEREFTNDEKPTRFFQISALSFFPNSVWDIEVSVIWLGSADFSRKIHTMNVE